MITSRFAKCAVAVGAIGLAAGLQSSAQAANTTATATAVVATAISIVKNVDMSFGTIATTGIAGTVVLGTDGSRTCTDVDCLAAFPGAAADFTVSGIALATYSITLPGLPVNLDDGGGNLLVISTPFVTLPAITGTLDGAGNQTLLVGATIDVDAAEVVGTYTATFAMTVNYN